MILSKGWYYHEGNDFAIIWHESDPSNEIDVTGKSFGEIDDQIVKINLEKKQSVQPILAVASISPYVEALPI